MNKEIELIEFDDKKFTAILKKVANEFQIEYQKLSDLVINQIQEEPVFKCSIDEFINILPKNV